MTELFDLLVYENHFLSLIFVLPTPRSREDVFMAFGVFLSFLENTMMSSKCTMENLNQNDGKIMLLVRWNDAGTFRRPNGILCINIVHGVMRRR